MSVTWRAAEQPRPCDHRRCTLAHWAAAACMIGAFLTLAWMLLFPSIPAIAAVVVLLAGGFGTAAWPCKPDEDGDDLMAVADAVREPVYIPSYVPAEWVKEHGR